MLHVLPCSGTNVTMYNLSHVFCSFHGAVSAVMSRSSGCLRSSWWSSAVYWLMCSKFWQTRDWRRAADWLWAHLQRQSRTKPRRSVMSEMCSAVQCSRYVTPPPPITVMCVFVCYVFSSLCLKQEVGRGTLKMWTVISGCSLVQIWFQM